MPTPFKLHFGTALTLTATAIGLTLPLSALADKTPQSLSAKVDGKVFESDDDGIMYLIPTKGVLNLIASTKGASAYPPPKTPVDKLSINCSSFDGKPTKYTFANSGSRICDISFTKGVSQKPFGDQWPNTDWWATKASWRLPPSRAKSLKERSTLNWSRLRPRPK